ncbi:hypothetical protein [Parasitella parasitica]|uniref:Tc1-like transposase DDE domain-containing protein n=1 Tax=Parasitella parasitica TaxID=35722 RepID=A0A0B7NS41_9FUNG|nr:hypothetical protein [Parasitella parasitica]
MTDINMYDYDEDIELNDGDSEQTDENETFSANTVTLRSYMRVIVNNEEAMEIDQGLLNDLQGEGEDDECEFTEPQGLDEQNVINQETHRKRTSKRNKTQKTCRKYTREQVVEFCALSQMGWTTKQAASKTGITLSNAYRYAQYYSQHQEVPNVWKPRGPPKAQTLQTVHELFIRSLIDDHGTHTLEYMRETLMKNFPEVDISPTAFYKFVRQNCALSIKKVQLISADRNSDDAKLKRREAVSSWLADKEMDFESNCVFLDEAGTRFQV